MPDGVRPASESSSGDADEFAQRAVGRLESTRAGASTPERQQARGTNRDATHETMSQERGWNHFAGIEAGERRLRQNALEKKAT